MLKLSSCFLSSTGMIFNLTTIASANSCKIGMRSPSHVATPCSAVLFKDLVWFFLQARLHAALDAIDVALELDVPCSRNP